MHFPINTNQPLRIALTEQVKHLAECVEKILQGPGSSLPLPLGIPSSSRVSGSQEEPIILSSDEDIKVKTENSEETVSKAFISHILYKFFF